MEVARPRGPLRALAAGLWASLLFAPSSWAEDPLRLPIGEAGRKDREIEVGIDRLVDSSGAALDPSRLSGKLSGTRLLLAGEAHTDSDAHRVQLRAISELARAGRRVEIALEMFPASAQPVLDAWSAGRLSEEEFLEQSGWYRHWGYSWRYYREIFRLARDRGLRMAGVNVPREIVSKVRRQGLSGLSAEERALLPEKIDTVSPEHRRLFRASLGEGALHGGGEEELEPFFAAQCVWDAAMASNALRLLGGDPKEIVVVLAGSGHVEYGLGIARQARAQGHPGPVATLLPVPMEAGKASRTVRASYGDWLWGIPPDDGPDWPALGASTIPKDGGLAVIHVEEGSPAEKAGLAAGDLLVSFDEAPLPDREALSRRMDGKDWADSVRLGIRRDGSPRTIEVSFRRSPAAAAPSPKS